MNIKMIALDLDDTTLDPGGKLTSNTRKAIERAIGMNIEIVVASGRAFTALPEAVIKIPGIRYAVTSNGAAVNRLPDGERILSNVLSRQAVAQVLKVADEYYESIALEAFIDGIPYSGREHVEFPERYGCSKAYIGYIQTTRTPVEDIRQFIRQHDGEIDSLDIACPDEEKRNSIRKLLTENLTDVYITSSVKHLTEIIAENCGKDSGVKYICDVLGISPEETVSCGNGDNDIDMMKFTRIGAAVANASKNCLESADLIIGRSGEDGVADFINAICDGSYEDAL